MELLLITQADTHLLSREPLPDPRRPADHCCLWSLTTVNSPTQPMRHASLPVCSQRACFPPCACVCVCLSEWVCVCTGPVLKGTDNRWWLQVIQTTANAERNCWLFIILCTADLQQLFTLFKGQGLFRATLYFPQHIRVRDTWFIKENIICNIYKGVDILTGLWILAGLLKHGFQVLPVISIVIKKVAITETLFSFHKLRDS